MGGLRGRNPGQMWLDTHPQQHAAADAAQAAKSGASSGQSVSAQLSPVAGQLTPKQSDTKLTAVETEEQKRLRLSRSGSGQLTNTSSTGKKTTLG